jgi:hypothetical protein
MPTTYVCRRGILAARAIFGPLWVGKIWPQAARMDCAELKRDRPSSNTSRHAPLHHRVKDLCCFGFSPPGGVSPVTNALSFEKQWKGMTRRRQAVQNKIVIPTEA